MQTGLDLELYCPAGSFEVYYCMFLRKKKRVLIVTIEGYLFFPLLLLILQLWDKSGMNCSSFIVIHTFSYDHPVVFLKSPQHLGVSEVSLDLNEIHARSP